MAETRDIAELDLPVVDSWEDLANHTDPYDETNDPDWDTAPYQPDPEALRKANAGDRELMVRLASSKATVAMATQRLASPAPRPKAGPPRAVVLGPQKRVIKGPKPQVGGDVYAYKVALARAKIARWEPKWFALPTGWAFRKGVRALQRRHGLKVDGVVGPATHRVMGRYMNAYAVYRYHKFTPGPKVTPDQQKRINGRAYLMYLYHNRHRVSYTMSGLRMMIVRRKLPKPPRCFRDGQIYEDCSSSGKGLHYWIGAPDPNGFGFNNSWGYTGTMVQHGYDLPTRGGRYELLDEFFYGGYSVPSHVAYYIGGGLVWSHGKESDPSIRSGWYRGVTRVKRQRMS